MSSSRLSTIILILSGALFILSATLYLRGPRVPADMLVEHAHEHDGEMVIELLANPTDVAPFTVTDLDGRVWSSLNWRGKVVLINFWATWCPPCLAEIPALVALQEKYKDELLIVGISEDHAPVDFVKTFAAERKINYPLVMSTPDLQAMFPGIAALPTTFVLNPEGKMVKRHVGMLHAEETEALTRALAGLSVNARVEYVEDPSKLSASSESQITDIPGIDMSAYTPEQRIALVQTLNSEPCTCGCGLTVAKCRVDDPACPVSLPLAQSIAEKLTQ